MAWQSEVRDAGLCPHSVHPGGQRLRAAACSRGSKNRYEYGEGVRAPELAGPVRRGGHAGKQSAQAIFSTGPGKKGCATREEFAEVPSSCVDMYNSARHLVQSPDGGKEGGLIDK